MFTLAESNKYILSPGTNELYKQVVRLGDIDKDGHLDMIITLQEKSTKKRYSYFYQNVNCFDVNLAQVKPCRQFKKYEGNYFEELSTVESYAAAFFDWGELGYTKA